MGKQKQKQPSSILGAHPRGKMVSMLWAHAFIRFTISSWNLTWHQKIENTWQPFRVYILPMHTLMKSRGGLKFTMTHLHAWPFIAKVPNSLTLVHWLPLGSRYMISIVPITHGTLCSIHHFYSPHYSCLLSCLCKNDLVLAFVLVYYFGHTVPMTDVWNKIIHKKV
jgi:hypothetical protein